MPPPLLKEVEFIKKRDRKSLSFELKREILKRVESGVQRSDVCKEFGLADSTVRHIIKVSDKIKHHFAQSKLPKQARYAARASLLEELDKGLFKFIEFRKTHGEQISTHLIFEEAIRLFNELKYIYKGPKNFKPTRSWYVNFENRANARNIFIPKEVGPYRERDISSDDNEDYEANNEVMHSDDPEIPAPDDCNNFEDSLDIRTEMESQESKKLTKEVIETALNHIETAFELLEKHDSDWERVSSLRRNINHAVSSYKELLIMSRDKPKQNAIYDLLKNVTRKSEVSDSQIEDMIKQ